MKFLLILFLPLLSQADPFEPNDCNTKNRDSNNPFLTMSKTEILKYPGSTEFVYNGIPAASLDTGKNCVVSFLFNEFGRVAKAHMTEQCCMLLYWKR